jgi:hypothetical protein
MPARMWFRIHWKVAMAFAAATAVTGILGIAYSWNLSCDPSLSSAECSRFLNRNGPSTSITLILAVIPVLLGSVLGVLATASEFEGRTTEFAWSIVPSRRRWLVESVASGLLVLGVVGLLCAVFNAMIVAKLNPGHDLVNSFVGYGLWGPILIIRGACAFGLALLIGLVLRRTVASLTLSVILATAAVLVALIAGRSFQTAEVLPNGPGVDDALGVGSVVAAADGSYKSWSDCVQAEPSDLGIDDRANWGAVHCPEVPTYLPGSDMIVVEARESLVLLAVGLLGMGGTLVLVAGRRP